MREKFDVAVIKDPEPSGEIELARLALAMASGPELSYELASNARRACIGIPSPERSAAVADAVVSSVGLLATVPEPLRRRETLPSMMTLCPPSPILTSTFSFFTPGKSASTT